VVHTEYGGVLDQIRRAADAAGQRKTGLDWHDVTPEPRLVEHGVDRAPQRFA